MGSRSSEGVEPKDPRLRWPWDDSGELRLGRKQAPFQLEK